MRARPIAVTAESTGGAAIPPSIASGIAERRFAPAATVNWTDAGGELVIFDCLSGSYHALNGPASAIWRTLNEGRSADLIVEVLAGRFDADRNAIAADVAAFLSRALAGGLIVEVA
jgi:PqqD family protein of HPr-rel-A system